MPKRRHVNGLLGETIQNTRSRVSTPRYRRKHGINGLDDVAQFDSCSCFVSLPTEPALYAVNTSGTWSIIFPDSSAASLAAAGTIAGGGGITGVLGGIPGHIAVMHTDDASSKGTHSCDDDVPLAGQRTLPTREEVH